MAFLWTTSTVATTLIGNTTTLTYTMKVLMFGWEFPPHISGGLGTACAGLTHALEKAEVDIIFTVPKLHGGERADRATFVNASTIPIGQIRSTIPLDTLGESVPENPDRGNNPQFPSHIRGRRQTLVEVPALLSPYTYGDEPAYKLQHWSYALEHRKEDTLPTNLRTKTPGLRHPQNFKDDANVKEPYAFTGSYGTNLLEEVDRYALAGAEIAASHSFDVIHAHDWMTFPAGIAAKRKSGKPLVAHVHATEVDRSGSQVNEKVFAIEKSGMELADKVVTVSHWTKKIAIEKYGIDAAKIEVVHNGITPRKETTTRLAAAPFNAPIVTFLGRITHQKGPLYFVQAARKVHEHFPDVHFVVAGSGDQLPAMLERIAAARLSGHFHFTGFLKGDEVERIWAMSSVYVMPSVSEPFGIAPLEAIQAGVPVIISKQTGVSEVMPHAIKVDFWDTDTLAEAICTVLHYRSLANTLKTNGVNQINEITWDKAAKKLITLYYDLTKLEKAKKPDVLLSGPPAQTTKHAAVL